MSKVDDVFDFADELVAEWGSPAVFVRREDSVYDPNTGEVTQTETRTDVNVVISSLDITEDNGLYQANDVKLIIDPVQLNYIYITEQDYFELPKAGGTEIMKVIDPKTYRGERPVAYVIIARPQ